MHSDVYKLYLLLIRSTLKEEKPGLPTLCTGVCGQQAASRAAGLKKFGLNHDANKSEALSTMDIFRGKVIEIKEGVVIAKVRIDIGGGFLITHTIMIEDVLDLDITVGDEVCTLIKGDRVRLMKELS